MEAVEAKSDEARLWTRIRLSLVALVLCRGLVWLCVLPPFEGWDEYQHVGYVQHIAETGEAAALGETNVSPSLLLAQGEFPQSKTDREDFDRFGVLGFSNYWTSPRAVPTGEAEVKDPDVIIPLYQAQHGALYYRIAAPFYQWAGGVDRLKVSVGLLRLLNLSFIVAAVWLALGAVGRVVADVRLASLFGLLIATQPLFLINGVRVANDALGVLLATLVIAMGLTWREDRGLARSVLWGAAAGFAVLAKSVNLGLVPFVGFCWLAAAVQQGGDRRRALASASLIALGAIVVCGPELAANLGRYGMITPMVEAVQNRRNGMTAADLFHAAKGIEWWTKLSGIWLYDNLCKVGWSFFDAGPKLMVRHKNLVVACLLGWLLYASRRTRPPSPVFRNSATPIACLVLCLSFTAALSYHMVQSKLAQGVSMTNTWYAASTLPWFLVLVAGGALSWPVGRLRPILPAMLATTFLTAESVTLWGRLVPTCSGGADGWEALHRLASLQPALLGTPTLLAALAGQLVALTFAVALWVRSERRGPIGEVAAPAGTLRPIFMRRSALRTGRRASFRIRSEP